MEDIYGWRDGGMVSVERRVYSYSISPSSLLSLLISSSDCITGGEEEEEGRRKKEWIGEEELDV